MHPFPSLLNASASFAVATLAGGDLGTAARIGLSMLGLQTSIGALNDVVDAPLDAGQKPGKPIPRGVLSPRMGTVVAGITGLVGLGLSVPSGIPTIVAACLVIALGYLYDLRLSRTSLSWLPLAVALPVLPIHAWLGATGAVASGLVALVPAAVLAGAGLALGNGLVDVERDAAAGRRGIVVALGARRGWLVHSGLFVAVIALAVLLAPAPVTSGAPAAPFAAALATLRTVGMPMGIVSILVGALALQAQRPRIRERGWELEAVGVAAAGIAWLAGTAAVAAPA